MYVKYFDVEMDSFNVKIYMFIGKKEFCEVLFYN